MGSKNEVTIKHFGKPINSPLAIGVVVMSRRQSCQFHGLSLMARHLLGNSQFSVISQCRDDVTTSKCSIVDQL